MGALAAQGPYTPAAGVPGSRAIAQDSSLIIGWGQNCRVLRGPRDFARPGGLLASFGDSSDALGPANGQVVSLGDSGYAEYFFDPPLADRIGPEVAIFENSFSDTYLELAFVEISSDGQRFVRFPAHCLTQDSLQLGPFGQTDPTQIHNFAGKYRLGYGVPFDWAELRDSAGLDIDSIRYLRIVDVIGAIGQRFSSYDSEGRPINDPYPTDFASGGFDLDALAILGTSPLDLSPENKKALFFPNPASQELHWAASVRRVELLSLQGYVLRSWQNSPQAVNDLPRGYYLLRLYSAEQSHLSKLLLR